MAKRPASKSKSSSKSKSGSRKKSTSKQLPEFKFDFSREKLIEISGIVFLIFGFITLIMTVFAKADTFFAKWPDYLLLQTGLFSYVLPIIFIVIGAWFLLSRYKQFPDVTIPRLIGATALIFNLITWFQLFHAADPRKAIPEHGGGKVGEAIYNWFHHGLGTPGAVIMLIAWLLISLMLLVNLSMPALLAWLVFTVKDSHSKFVDFIRKQVEIQRQKKKNRENLQKILDDHPIQPQLTFEEESKDTSIERAPSKPSVETPPKASPTSRTTWQLPDPEDILKHIMPVTEISENDEDRARVIEETLRSFKAPGTVVEIRRGPTVTLFGVEPDYIETRSGKNRVRVKNITALSNDIALALKASRIRIQAPVPGKGYIGIEVPNARSSIVGMLDIIHSNSFQKQKSLLRFPLGKDVTGNPVSSDLAKMPHLLIAGTTGSGKSVCINAILAGYLLTLTPDQIRFMLVDPKRVELTGYNGIPHLLTPVITDANLVLAALQRIMREMDLRYQTFVNEGVRNIEDYNHKAFSEGRKELPYIVVVIDELADMMILASNETERALVRLAQLARATGIHLIIATQRPSVDVITGLIKANFPARIAFAVAAGMDSRVILDQPGAERLLGRGGMLFLPPDAPEPFRLQGTYVSDEEINKLTNFWRMQAAQEGAPERPDYMTPSSTPPLPLIDDESWDIENHDPDTDPIEADAIDYIRKERKASVSMLQRKFRIGYTRSARIIEKLEKDGIIGPPSNSGAREVLDYGDHPQPD